MKPETTHLMQTAATVLLFVALVGAASAAALSSGGWHDGALWLAAWLGVLVFGLWGDRIVGVAILGVAAIVDALLFVARRAGARRGDRREASSDSAGAREIERAQPLQR